MSNGALANVTTFGVEDLVREQAFYSDLGWPIVFEAEDFIVFELSGALLALFPLDKLAADSHAEPEPRRGGIRSSIIVNVERPEHVDELADRVARAGGVLTKPQTDAEFFLGRDAYFADPEGNYWEIAYAPSDNPVTVAARRAAKRRVKESSCEACCRSSIGQIGCFLGRSVFDDDRFDRVGSSGVMTRQTRPPTSTSNSTLLFALLVNLHVTDDEYGSGTTS